MEQQYGREGARKRIYATTDRKQGALKQLAETEGYETFVIPDDVGGRYSVLTAVGLLPIAAAGIDLDQMMAGAREARVAFGTPDLMENALTNMRPSAIFCIGKASMWSFWFTMSRLFNIFPSGGNNFSVKVKARMGKEFFRRRSNSPRICIPWDSISRKDTEISLRR